MDMGTSKRATVRGEAVPGLAKRSESGRCDERRSVAARRAGVSLRYGRGRGRRWLAVGEPGALQLGEVEVCQVEDGARGRQRSADGGLVVPADRSEVDGGGLPALPVDLAAD